MKQHIPEQVIEDVRQRAEIIDVVSDFVHLKKAGKNYKGLCPFHQEKTPSFTASPDKQIYHCFGCGAGGQCLQIPDGNGGPHFRRGGEEAGGALPRHHPGIRPAFLQPAV
ncbi:CHC2 zinc finger domain-containing protein [Nitrospina gracilis]|uniref:CHC2 zinc finger domain-containing protein n=1 Tax=Nitrospina gracilis TaxID=35801 RepID=UPI000A034144|nr:CHC2 zinc finger domain-containing protein [Nitrospina gracilis]